MSKGVEFIKDIGLRKPREDSKSPKKYRYVLAKCLYCGKEFETRKRGFDKLKSCQKCAMGIRPVSIRGECNLRHGLSRSGVKRHPLYSRWESMKKRCNNKNCRSYKTYGGRGIKVCDDWNRDPKLFYDWAIENGFKEALQLDRIDNDGNYEPDNCRWVTGLVNANNKSRMRSNNTTGFVGIGTKKDLSGFYAVIHSNGKNKYLGHFATPEEASTAYEKAKEEKLLKMEN